MNHPNPGSATLPQPQADARRPAFWYTPLDSGRDEIRVLHVQPHTDGTSPDGSPIICSLETISLNNVPDYVALSYTWGPPHQNPLHVIRLEGTTFPVTESLYTALQHLRPASTTDAALTIWIDAACINQFDDLEKADQVRKMRRIYQLASQVLIWLGLSGNDSDTLLDLITQIGQAVDDLGLSGVNMHAIQTMPDDELAETNEKLDMLFEEFNDIFPATFPKAAYEAFVARPWWYRVWVVQELALNTNEPIFAVGDRRVSYGLLRNFTSFLLLLKSAEVQATRYMRDVQESIAAQQAQTGGPVGGITEAEVARKERFDAIQAICATTAVDVMIGFRSRYNRLKDERPHTLLSILKHTVIRLSGERGKMALLATDERDRVYALLGLAEDADVVLNVPIRYDRDWTAADVYRATTRELLVNGDLEVLSVTRDPLAQKAKGLPSWICSWSATTCDLPFGDGTHVDRPFTAGGLFRPGDVTLDEHEPDIVAINGIRVGTVIGLTTYIAPGTELPVQRPDLPIADYTPVSTFIAETQSLCAQATMPSPMSEADVARLLVADYELVFQRGADADLPLTQSTSLSTPTPLSTSPFIYYRRCATNGVKALSRLHAGLRWLDYAAQMVAMNGAMSRGTFTPALMQQVAALQARTAEVPAMMAGLGEFWSHFKEQLERRAWRSDTGFVGLGPPAMLEGDVVVVFRGSPVANVVRRVGDRGRWVLVGEAYVHGVMDGELVQGGNVVVERFELE
jgi:hypothetical protein